MPVSAANHRYNPRLNLSKVAVLAYIGFMRKEPASASRTAYAALSPRCRSSVTNGRRLHVDHIGDTKWNRRFRDVLSEIISDLGGPDQLSEGQRQLARRAATISLECERLESKAVADEAIDLELYGRLSDRLGRTFGRLGLKRVANDVTPTLETYLRQTYSDRDGDERPTEAADSLEPEPGNEAALPETLTYGRRRPAAEPSP
jgi:hypothetical protein